MDYVSLDKCGPWTLIRSLTLQVVPWTLNVVPWTLNVVPLTLNAFPWTLHMLNTVSSAITTHHHVPRKGVPSVPSFAVIVSQESVGSELGLSLHCYFSVHTDPMSLLPQRVILFHHLILFLFSDFPHLRAYGYTTIISCDVRHHLYTSSNDVSYKYKTSQMRCRDVGDNISSLIS
jgi:hypothetical protein